MPSTEITASSIRRRSTRLQRALLSVLMLLLSLQLLGTAYHKHALLGADNDCAACHFVQHLPTDVPPPAQLAAPTPAILYFHTLPVFAFTNLARASFLIPDAQAPPRASSPL